MLEQKCSTCRWYDTDFEICCNDTSKYRADFRLREDTCGKWELHPGLKNNWKREAQEQAVLRRHLALEDNNLDQVILQWKIEQLQRQIEWFEAVL